MTRGRNPIDERQGHDSVQQIVDELPPLEIEDVTVALRFAVDAVADREIPLQPAA